MTKHTAHGDTGQPAHSPDAGSETPLSAAEAKGIKELGEMAKATYVTAKESEAEVKRQMDAQRHQQAMQRQSDTTRHEGDK